MQLLIVTGHSQISHTAVAIATACRAAQQGKRVLLASTGPVHLLGSLLNLELSSRPREIEQNLAAVEVQSIGEAGDRWDALRPSFRSGLAARLRDIRAEELPSFPGLDAVGAVLIAERARQSEQFDLLVLDGPSPDNLIRTLSLPDALRWLIRLVFGIDRGPGKSRSSQEQAILPASLIAPNAHAPLQDLRVALEEQRERLTSNSGSRVRLVVSPTELGLPVTRETLIGLGIYGLETDQLVVQGLGSVSEKVRDEHERPGLNRPPLVIGPIDESPAAPSEWAERGSQLYGAQSLELAEARSSTTNREVRLAIPFIDPQALDVAVANEELVVQLGQFRRHLLLPGLLNGGKLRARVDAEILRLWVE